MVQTNVVQNIKTHILGSLVFFFENHAVYEIMWKNIVQRGRPHTTIWRMRIACWIPKATNTQTGCVILTVFSTTTVVARTPLKYDLRAKGPGYGTIFLAYFLHRIPLNSHKAVSKNF
jgi:hypothetical protein